MRVFRYQAPVKPQVIRQTPIMYSLFRKNEYSKRWERIVSTAYTEKIACYVYRSIYASNPLAYSIRPIGEPDVHFAQAVHGSRFRTAIDVPDLRTYVNPVVNCSGR